MNPIKAKIFRFRLRLLLFSYFLFCMTIVVIQVKETRKVAVFDPEDQAKTVAKEIVREEISSVVVNMQGYNPLKQKQKRLAQYNNYKKM
ncbi:MAG: hypothetical protein LBE56_14590 [Tannerella sp.]|jgi:hypothetical protein|nr:hypothetical protein [Tannerella sp.]